MASDDEGTLDGCPSFQAIVVVVLLLQCGRTAALAMLVCPVYVVDGCIVDGVSSRMDRLRAAAAPRQRGCTAQLLSCYISDAGLSFLGDMPLAEYA